MAAPVIQIVHISDLHLIEPASLDNYLHHLSTLPTALVPSEVLQREDYQISAALPSEVAALCRNLPSIVVLTGDIGTWPGDTPDVINGHQYELIRKLPGAVSILGNHDWGPLGHVTSYGRSAFGTTITTPRCLVFTEGGVTLILFLIDSNIRMFPSQGIINDTTRARIQDWFNAGRGGTLGAPGQQPLSVEQYAKALKLLLLHHTPLERSEYNGALGPVDYWNLQLRDRPGLCTLCKDDIDAMLFGHTHVPLDVVWNGFLMVNCGTTTGLGGWRGINNLQRMTIYDDLSIDVQSFNWNGLRFVAQQRSARYMRGLAPAGVLGRNRWG